MERTRTCRVLSKESGKGEPNIGVVVAKFTSKLRNLDRSAFAYEPQSTHMELNCRSETVLERVLSSPQAASRNPIKD